MIPLRIIAALSCGARQKHFYNLLIHVYWPTDLTINIDLRSLSAAAQYNHIFHAGQQPESSQRFSCTKKGPIFNRALNLRRCKCLCKLSKCVTMSLLFLNFLPFGGHTLRKAEKERFISGAFLQKSRLKGKELRHGWEIKETTFPSPDTQKGQWMQKGIFTSEVRPGEMLNKKSVCEIDLRYLPNFLTQTCVWTTWKSAPTSQLL